MFRGKWDSTSLPKILYQSRRSLFLPLFYSTSRRRYLCSSLTPKVEYSKILVLSYCFKNIVIFLTRNGTIMEQEYDLMNESRECLMWWCNLRTWAMMSALYFHVTVYDLCCVNRKDRLGWVTSRWIRSQVLEPSVFRNSHNSNQA